LNKEYAITFLEQPEDTQMLTFQGATIAIHGLHTLSTFLHAMPKEERDNFLDAYITSLNENADCHVVLLHNPDGLEFLLSRLQETHKQLIYPTLFLAGHTHGAMLDMPLLRNMGLYACKTQFGRYKGWYGPEGKYTTTGNWKLYVSTGMGNSPGCDYRLNASPEVVLMQF
jgi:predicted MPP superfamily phosphohydrolase